MLICITNYDYNKIDFHGSILFTRFSQKSLFNAFQDAEPTGRFSEFRSNTLFVKAESIDGNHLDGLEKSSRHAYPNASRSYVYLLTFVYDHAVGTLLWKIDTVEWLKKCHKNSTWKATLSSYVLCTLNCSSSLRLLHRF